jgi:hypothetical protein
MIQTLWRVRSLNIEPDILEVDEESFAFLWIVEGAEDLWNKRNGVLELNRPSPPPGLFLLHDPLFALIVGGQCTHPGGF